ncbi:MAG: anti-sigma factor [Rubrobacteraceae bacterium]
MSHERFDELKDAYALGALPEDELRDFEAYLAAHPERRAEVEEHASIASLLAVSPADQAPPKRLRRNVMAMVKAESRGRRAERRAERRTSYWRSSLEGLRGLFSPRVALGAAAVVVAGLLSWNVFLQSEIRDLSGRNGELQAQIEEVRSGQSDGQIFAMHGQREMRDSEVEILAFEGERAVLVGENMPAIPEGRTLQIWVIDDEGAKPSGLFQPNGDPVAAVVRNPLKGANTIAVTIEPAGGSPQPTTDPMLTAQI